MSGTNLYLKFEDLLTALYKADTKGEFDGDEQALSAFDSLKDDYNKKTPDQIYAGMILAESVLFGGEMSEIRTRYDQHLNQLPDVDKAGFVASKMRERIVHDMPDDGPVAHIGNILRFYEDNDERAWECLFAAAAYSKSVSLEAFRTFVVSVYERTTQARVTKDADLYASLQKEVAVHLEDKPPIFQYSFQINMTSLITGIPIMEVDAAMVRNSGGNDVEGKLAYVNKALAVARAERMAPPTVPPTHYPPGRPLN